MPKRIVVCGATGVQGRHVVEALLGDKEKWTVVALTRNPDSPAAQALKEKGAAMSTPYKNGHLQPPQYERAQLDAIATACSASKIAHVVFSTIYASERPTGVAALDCKLDAEDRLKELGVPATFLRLSALMTNISAPWSPVTHSMVQGLSAPDAKTPWLAPEDVGRAAVACFARGKPEIGKSYFLVGDVLSGAELAALLSRLRGYAIAYKAPPKMMLRVFAPDYAKQVDLTDSKGLGERFQKTYRQVYQEARDGTAALLKSSSNSAAALSFEAWLLRWAYDKRDLPRKDGQQALGMLVFGAATVIAAAASVLGSAAEHAKKRR